MVMVSKRARLRQIWSETRWILLGVIWLAGLSLGYAGFNQFSRDHELGWTSGDILYRTLQLILLESGSVSGSVNWMLETTRFLLPILTAITALQALLHLFEEQLQWLRLWRVHDHVIICGLGRKGDYLASQLLALGQRVVVIEKMPQSTNAIEIQRQGGILISGDATDQDILSSARPQRARHVICLLGEDRQNLQTAFQAYHLTRGRRSGKLTCILHLTSPDMLNLVKRSELTGQRDVPFQLETFNPYARTAQLLVQQDLDWQEAAKPSCIPEHLLVIGMGCLGEHLIFQSAYAWHTLKQRGRLSITILDREAKEKTALLLQKNAQLAEACQLTSVSIDLSSTEALLDALRVEKPIQRVYICLSDPVLSLQVCLGLLQISTFRNVPIYMRLGKESGLSGLLDKLLIGETFINQVFPFDLYERACSAELVMGGQHEVLARSLHESYLTETGTPPHEQAWSQLVDEQKETNRQQAHRIHFVLNAAGYQINPLQNWDAGQYAFGTKELRKMATMEHDLWCQEKLADGWRLGPERNANKRTHPDLIPWEKLPDSERKKNETFIRKLPSLLARLGFQVDQAHSGEI